MVFDFNSQEDYDEESFSDLDCSGKKLNLVNFFDCKFTKINFAQAIFAGCKFKDCVFENCDLSLINIKNTVFSGVNFQNSKLVGIDWSLLSVPRLVLNSPFNFKNCVISSSSFFGLDLKKIKIIDCIAKDCDFSETNLIDANLQNTDFQKSMFNHTKLISADFTRAYNYNIDLKNNDLKNAKFSLPDAINLLNSCGIVLV